MTSSLIHAGPVMDAGIRMVLFSKGLSLETRNLRAKDVCISIKKFPKPTNSYVSVLTPPTQHSQTQSKSLQTL